ncbi:MAG: SpoIIE family protein phosphatase [Patescibacteria group bacterium]|nr:SpoIIE family protein phosphatase [Patescibacteria group bacterium]
MKESILNITKPKESIPSFEKFSGLWEKGFEDIKIFNGKSGRIVMGTDKGLREQNEDIIAVDFGNDAFAVIDGMGGYAHGQEAAQIVGLQFLKAVKEKLSPREMHKNAHIVMQCTGFKESGAVYLAGQIEKKKLKIWSAGDAHLVVVDSKGEIKFSSKYTTLQDAPSGHGLGEAKTDFTLLENYDRIFVGSDGLFNNIKDEELKNLKGVPIEKAMQELVKSAKNAMKNGLDENTGGSPDNLTILIYEILPTPLRGKN